MDLSKTFQKLNYYLLIAKLGTYGFQIDAKRYMKNYLTYKKQRISEKKNYTSHSRQQIKF